MTAEDDREPDGVTPPADEPEFNDRPPQFGFAHGRAETVDGVDPNAQSLIGSWFHVEDGDRFTMQGCVVAEPQPTWYLVQLYDWTDGQPTHQRLVHFGEMGGEAGSAWRFFDSAEDMNRAFEASVSAATVDD